MHVIRREGEVERNSYLGGVVSGRSVERLTEQRCADSLPKTARFRRCGEMALFLDVCGSDFTVHTDHDVTLLMRGYAVPDGASRLPDQRELAAELCQAYRTSGGLPVENLEGSFTLALIDERQGKAILYRNLVGTGFTYYTQAHGGLIFASNLAELVALLDAGPKPNQTVLPVFFVYRSVPGRQTLFDGIYRLMPGELLSYDADGLVVEQRQTFADLEEPEKLGANAIERLEEVMGRVMADCAAIDPKAANLLSGGVDSSYIQAHWNSVVGRAPEVPRSATICVEHPGTKGDRDYAISAAEHFGTSHSEFPANGSYGRYLIEAIASTGEPPNHVQTAYCGPFARFMHRQGMTTGLCGEGADSLLGTDYGPLFRRAAQFRRLVPVRGLRHMLARLADSLQKDTTAYCLRLAGCMTDFTDREHPVNEIAAFTDWPAVARCFGGSAIDRATAYRRQLLEQYAIPRESLVRVHAAGFLGEAMETASLWTTCFQREGVNLLCPYMDSRLLRVAVNIDPRYRFSEGEPKRVLKQALCRHAPREMVYRQKLGFGQPIFEWMSRRGQLRPLVDAIGDYDFVKPEVLEEAKARPNWFLSTLLCYDLWFKLFVEKSISASGEEGSSVVLSANRS